MTMPSKITISSIFEKQGDSYLEDSLIYQDILCFPQEAGLAPFQGFKFTEMANWLLERSHPLKNKFKGSDLHTRKSYRLVIKRPFIEKRLNNLLDAGLVEEKGKTKAEKSQVEIPFYALTKTGHFIGLIIRHTKLGNKIISATKKNDVNKRQTLVKEINEVDEMIFNFLQDLLQNSRDAHSVITMFSSYLTKLKEENKLGLFISHIAEVLHSELSISNLASLLRHSRRLNIKDENTRKTLWQSWNDTLQDLKPKIKELVLYQLKLEFEGRIEDKVQYPQNFEIVRFKERADPYHIVTQTACKNCGKVEYRTRDYFEYRSRLTQIGLNEPLLEDCPECKKADSLEVLYR